MIAPILGESFQSAASLDNGRNGLASIGSTQIDTNSGLVSAGLEAVKNMGVLPGQLKGALGDFTDNLLGKQAYLTDAQGNKHYIADAWQANGLVGSHQARTANAAHNETKQELLDEGRNKWTNNVSGNTQIGSGKQADEQTISDVLSGKYGVGAQRKQNLEAAGYNYDSVQQGVNARLGKAYNNAKQNEQTAKTVYYEQASAIQEINDQKARVVLGGGNDVNYKQAYDTYNQVLVNYAGVDMRQAVREIQLCGGDITKTQFASRLPADMRTPDNLRKMEREIMGLHSIHIDETNYKNGVLEPEYANGILLRTADKLVKSGMSNGAAAYHAQMAAGMAPRDLMQAQAEYAKQADLIRNVKTEEEIMKHQQEMMKNNQTSKTTIGGGYSGSRTTKTTISNATTPNSNGQPNNFWDEPQQEQSPNYYLDINKGTDNERRIHYDAQKMNDKNTYIDTETNGDKYGYVNSKTGSIITKDMGSIKQNKDGSYYLEENIDGKYYKTPITRSKLENQIKPHGNLDSGANHMTTQQQQANMTRREAEVIDAVNEKLERNRADKMLTLEEYRDKIYSPSVESGNMEASLFGNNDLKSKYKEYLMDKVEDEKLVNEYIKINDTRQEQAIQAAENRKKIVDDTTKEMKGKTSLDMIDNPNNNLTKQMLKEFNIKQNGEEAKQFWTNVHNAKKKAVAEISKINFGGEPIDINKRDLSPYVLKDAELANTAGVLFKGLDMPIKDKDGKDTTFRQLTFEVFSDMRNEFAKQKFKGSWAIDSEPVEKVRRALSSKLNFLQGSDENTYIKNTEISEILVEMGYNAYVLGLEPDMALLASALGKKDFTDLMNSKIMKAGN